MKNRMRKQPPKRARMKNKAKIQASFYTNLITLLTNAISISILTNSLATVFKN